MLRASTFLVLLFLAFIFSNCSTNCEECADDFSVRFEIVDADGRKITTDPSQVALVDLNSNAFDLERDETEIDSLFLTSFAAMPQPDTVVFFINNAVLDTAAVEYGFKRDSECCINPRVVERLNFFNLDVPRVVRVNYNFYRITVE